MNKETPNKCSKISFKLYECKNIKNNPIIVSVKRIQIKNENYEKKKLKILSRVRVIVAVDPIMFDYNEVHVSTARADMKFLIGRLTTYETVKLKLIN